LLTSQGDPGTLFQLLWRRGERAQVELNTRQPQPLEFDVSHLFYGHELQLGSEFNLSAENQSPKRSLTVKVGEFKDQGELFSDDKPTIRRWGLLMEGYPEPLLPAIPLSRGGTVSSELLTAGDGPRRVRRRTRDGDRTHFITTESLSGDELVSLWNKVALTPDEALVLQALSFLDPRIERIAAQASVPPYYYAPLTSSPWRNPVFFEGWQ
jgi:hypothetical protein